MTAMNYYDQQRIKRKDREYMTSREVEKAKIGDLTLIEWINYFCFGPASPTGPSIEYKDVSDFLNLKGRY